MHRRAHEKAGAIDQLECRAAHLKIYMRPFSLMAKRSGLSSLQSISHTS